MIDSIVDSMAVVHSCVVNVSVMGILVLFMSASIVFLSTSLHFFLIHSFVVMLKSIKAVHSSVRCC